MPKKNAIAVEGARVNNLKNVSVEIPRESLVVITGLSGSGKSSLAFDTVYAEANRRYMESLSSYARQFLDDLGKPDVDAVRHLSPAIAIDQKSVSRSPRSTVGTLTEVYDYLRILYTRAGEPHCPQCHGALRRKSTAAILDEILNFPDGTHVAFLAKLDHTLRKTEKEALKQVEQWGYARVRFHNQLMTVTEAVPHASDMLLSELDVVVDRLVFEHSKPDRERILDSLETAFKLGRGTLTLLLNQSEERWYSREYRCETCDIRLPDLSPNLFSFNSPEGACQECGGLGVKLEFDAGLVIPNHNLSLREGAIRPWSKTGECRGPSNGHMETLRVLSAKHRFSLDVPVKKLSKKHLELVLHGDGQKQKEGAEGFLGVIGLLEQKYRETKSEHTRNELERYMWRSVCPACQGKRLKPESLAVLFEGKSIHDVSSLPVSDLRAFLKAVSRKRWSAALERIVLPLALEMEARLAAVEQVGLGYLDLSRSAETLSGGEAQRIRLSVQMKSDLTGVLYVLDEPSVGLHSRDTAKLLSALETLKEKHNSLIVVEHDPYIMKRADWIIDLGPGAGREGGELIFSGTPERLLQSKTMTGLFLSGRETVSDPKRAPRKSDRQLTIVGASEHNLKNVDVSIPLGCFVAVSGVSGSGKSSLIHDILSRALAKHFYQARLQPGKHTRIDGIQHIDKVVTVTQDPIGRTPRSNAATYTGIFTPIRELFAATAEAKKAHFEGSHFSFNMRGGRCETCQGGGLRKVEMYLLPDLYLPCETCRGTRYSEKTLAIEYRSMNIAQVLNMTVTEARAFFYDQPMIEEKLRVMEEVGLGYLILGQSATNLSGGEAQRIKLATELSRKSTGRTLYILDEPTIGLHFEDVRRLLLVLDALVDKGNTVLVVEHNTDIIKHADWVVDMGPEGGAEGGQVMFQGTPSKLKACKKSATAPYL